MKRVLLSLLVFGSIAPSYGQSYVARWDFNSLVNDVTTSTGNASAYLGTGTVSTVGGSTFTYAAGNPNDINSTDNSGFNTTTFPAQSTNPKTAGIQMDVSTVGFSRIQLEFYQRLSNTAPNTWVLQYTLDNTGASTGGSVVWTYATVYTFTPAPTGTGDTWYYRTHDFSAITGLSNNPNAAFRVVSDFDPITGLYQSARSTSSYGTGGTSRFDLISVKEAESATSIVTASNYQIVTENVGTVNVPVTVANANAASAKVVFEVSTYSSGNLASDFSWITTDTLTIPAGFNGVINFPLTIIDDANAEKAETIILKMKAVKNTRVSSTQYYQIIYVKDNDYTAPVATNELGMTLLSSFNNGTAGSNSAEIVVFDPTTDRLYIANSIGAKLDIVDFSNPSTPVLINSVSVTPYGNINSVTVHNGIVALAIENATAQLNGSIVFLDQNGTFINQVTAGAMPDMITFNKDYTKILTANEGEPNATYSSDPEGSVTIVDLTPGYAALTNANVTTISLTAFNGQEAALKAQGIRVFSTSASVAQDLEPEYIAISDDNTKAYVTLQENNAMLVINLTNNTIDALRPLGYSDYSTSSGNGMDASDQSGQVLITALPVKGAFMPDAISHATINGQAYLFTANEGDSREFGSVADAARISTLSLDSTVFKDQLILKNNRFAGRLNGLKYSGDSDNDGDLDEIHVMGGRSFSIWNAATGSLVFDSKDLIEQVVAAHPVYGAIFNASNSIGAPALKNRSDDKGPEPEGITTATINGNHYLMVSLERVGGAMIFNINTPSNPVFVGYYNNRSTTVSGPDLGAEGMIYIPANESPNGNAIVILANEVSSTLSIYQVNTCAELAGVVVSAPVTEICDGETANLSITGNASSSVQWLLDNQALVGETANTISVSAEGNYKVFVSNSTLACTDTSNTIQFTVNALPNVAISATDTTICSGDAITMNGLGAVTYAFDNGVSNNVSFVPTSSQLYTVTGTDVNNCENTATLAITVNTLPNVAISSTDSTICSGEAITLSGLGAVTYTFDNGVSNNVSFVPTSSQLYTVTGTDVNNCENTATLAITVNTLPNVAISATDSTICSGDAITLNGSGAINYTFNNGVTNNVSFVPTSSESYTVTGTDANNCENTATLAITVNTLPNVSISASETMICIGDTITLNGLGAVNYVFDNGVLNNTAFVPTSSETYTAIGTDANNCENSATIAITVNALPLVDLGVDTTICTYNGPFEIFAPAGLSMYDWSTGETTASISVNQSGTYEVAVVDANGCENSDELSVVFDPCLGLEEQALALAVYPNPTYSNVTVEFEHYMNNASVTIVDQLGRVASTSIVSGATMTIDLSNFSAGVYTVLLTEGSATEQIRIIKK